MSEAATRKKPMDSPIASASPPHFNQRCCGNDCRQEEFRSCSYKRFFLPRNTSLFPKD